MYRTADPRFRRRLNELESTLERANETAQSNLYIFTTEYLRPCLHSVSACVTSCIDASCPSLNLSQRDRIRRQRGRSGAEWSFDFYDDWEEEEGDGLLGWGGEEAIGGAQSGYGTVGVASVQPGRTRGMSYPKGGGRVVGAERRDGVVSEGPSIPGSSLFGRLFGGKSARPKGAAEHAEAVRLGGDLTEGEALLAEGETAEGRRGKNARHGRKRSNTVESGQTSDSYSSRGDLFPSDEEDDAIPLDDEFAMVLERRTTNSGFNSGPDGEASSGKGKRNKRPSMGRTSSGRRTVSIKSTRSSYDKRRSSSLQSPADEEAPTLSELKIEERQAEQEEEAEIQRRRSSAQKLASERGLASGDEAVLSSKEATPRNSSPVIAAVNPPHEPSQLPTPLATDEQQEDDSTTQQQQQGRTDKSPDT